LSSEQNGNIAKIGKVTLRHYYFALRKIIPKTIYRFNSLIVKQTEQNGNESWIKREYWRWNKSWTRRWMGL